MPLGNVTHMTQAERDALGAWIRQGANIPLMLQIAAGGFELRRAPRGGGRAADGGGVPAAAAARVADHPRPLERRGRLDPVGRPRPRHRPRERDALPESGRARALSRAASARPSCCSPTATSRSRARPARSPATTSPRSSRAASTCASSAGACSGKARRRSSFDESCLTASLSGTASDRSRPSPASERAERRRQHVHGERDVLVRVSSSGEWLAPPFRLRTKSIPVGTPAAASTIASWPAPETSRGASGSRARQRLERRAAHRRPARAATTARSRSPRRARRAAPRSARARRRRA